MKTNRFLIILLLISSILTSSCSKKKGDIVPDDMDIDLSDAISVPDLEKKAFIPGDSIISGRDLYQRLRTLIYVGDQAGTLLNNYLSELNQYEISGPKIFTYFGDQDGKIKSVIVDEQVSYNNQLWDYSLTVTDAGNPAMRIYWNVNPREAIAIFSPQGMNSNTVFMKNAIVYIEYSESASLFDKTMLITISNMDVSSPGNMSKLKMFIGLKDGVAHIYGNTIHPEDYLINESLTISRSWAFKAKNDLIRDIAVAKCALPPSATTADGMLNLWDDYSMDKILEQEIKTVYPGIPQQDLVNYINSAKGRAYFIGSQGFISNDTDVPENDGFTPAFIDLSGIAEPWVPKEVFEMTVSF